MSTYETPVKLHTYGSNSGWTMFRDAMAEFRPFTTSGAFKSIAGAGGTGILPEPHASAYLADPSVSYTVYSYETPIAWYSELECRWVVPEVSYSPTTTQHQHTVRVAVSQLGGAS